MQSLDDTRKFANQVIESLRKVDWVTERAVVLGLSGDLGAGKTTFVQCVSKVLGVTDIVTSPTFVLRADYDTADTTFKKLIHIDAYRIENIAEVDTIDWDTIHTVPYTLVIVEWSERIQKRLPPDSFFITITTKKNDRIFTTTPKIP